MNKKKYHIVAWETDEHHEPTGKERFFVSDSTRKVIRQLASELGGDCGTSGLILRMSDGKQWSARSYKKEPQEDHIINKNCPECDCPSNGGHCSTCFNKKARVYWAF